MRIIDKTGPLANPADRDHCIQYMVAVPLLFGRLTAADYEDVIASDPRIDLLRSQDGSAVRTPRSPRNTTSARNGTSATRCKIFFSDDSPKLEMRVDFPVGHRKRRAEGMPLLVQKFEASVAAHFPARQTEAIKAVFARNDFDAMPVNEFMASLVAN